MVVDHWEHVCLPATRKGTPPLDDTAGKGCVNFDAAFKDVVHSKLTFPANTCNIKHCLQSRVAFDTADKDVFVEYNLA